MQNQNPSSHAINIESIFSKFSEFNRKNFNESFFNNLENINIQNIHGRTPLMFFAKIGNIKSIKICKLLIDKGALINIQNEYGDTALMIAIDKNNTEICKLLIENRALLNIQNEDGDTALMIAIQNDSTEICKLLIEKKALLNIQDEYGDTALMIAIKKNKNIEICKLLIDNGALLDIQDKYGNTGLMIAIKKNNIELSKILIEKGAHLDIQYKNGKTILIHTIENKNIEICKLLIEKGALLDIQDKDGNTALFIAIFQNNIDLCKLLIDKGAFIDLIIKKHIFTFTYLIYSIQNNYIKIAEMLIEKGANIFIRDNSSRRPLYFVREKERSVISNFNPEKRDTYKIIIKLLEENSTINKFIKARINDFKKDKTFNHKIIFKYFNDINNYHYNSCNKINYISLNSHPTKRNEELQRLISNTSTPNDLLHKKIRIKYENEEGINAGGLSKEFFDNLEKQINLKTEYQKKIFLKEKEYNFKIKELKQRKKGNNSINIKENNSNTVKELKKSIHKLPLDIKNLKQLLNECHDYPLEQIVKILAISKVNCNPIFYINENLRKLILLEISKQFSKNIEKNFIYNTLNFISEEEPTILKKNRESMSLLLNEKKISSLVEKNEKKRSALNILEKIEDDYLKVLLKKNNERIIPFNGNSNGIKMDYLTSNNIKDLEKNSSNIVENQQNILDLIKIYINDLKIYQDIYDFYLSHFYQKIITLDSFYRNLKFVFIPDKIKEDQKEAIKNDLITFFNDLKLTSDELYLFNKAISGRENKLSKEYTFNIYLNEEDKLPHFHTCYTSVDIYLSSFFRRYVNNKKDFIFIVKEAIATGFQIH